MPKGRGRHKRATPIPRAHPALGPGESPLNLLTLDRFSAADLDAWRGLSAKLDELARILYFAVEPERIRRREALIDALHEKPGAPMDFEGWVRVVDTRWTLSPLSSAGSLRGYGGRFNIGRDVASSNTSPFPALYVGENFETAYRERFQMEQGETAGGLTPEELALGASVSSYRVRGHVERVFDASNLGSLSPVAKVLAKFKMPAEAVVIAKLLKMRKASDMLFGTQRRCTRRCRWPTGESGRFNTSCLHPARSLATWPVLPATRRSGIDRQKAGLDTASRYCPETWDQTAPSSS